MMIRLASQNRHATVDLLREKQAHHLMGESHF